MYCTHTPKVIKDKKIINVLDLKTDIASNVVVTAGYPQDRNSPKRSYDLIDDTTALPEVMC